MVTGCYYEGEFKNDRIDGRRVWTWPDGCIYEGEFKNDQIEGTGVYQWPDKHIHNGEFKNDQIEGSGVYKWPDGDIYEGEYKNGNKEGMGIFMSANGDIYEGKWKDGKKEGSGVYRWPNGDIYDGEYKNDKKEGMGIFKSANGDIYEGKWKDGKRENDKAIEESEEKSEAKANEELKRKEESEKIIKEEEKQIKKEITINKPICIDLQKSKDLLNSTESFEKELTSMKVKLERFIQLFSEYEVKDKEVVEKTLVDIVKSIERIRQQLDSLSRVIKFKANAEEAQSVTNEAANFILYLKETMKLCNSLLAMLKTLKKEGSINDLDALKITNDKQYYFCCNFFFLHEIS